MIETQFEGRDHKKMRYCPLRMVAGQVVNCEPRTCMAYQNDTCVIIEAITRFTSEKRMEKTQ